MESLHPGLGYAYWLDLDWGHLKPCSHDHTDARRAYDELLVFSQCRALLLVLSVSGDDGYGALFAGSLPYATHDKLLEADGVDLAAFYGVGSGGGSSQKVIPPSRIVPELLDTDEQRTRLRRTIYTVAGDWLEDESRWAGQDAAIADLCGRFGLVAPEVRTHPRVGVEVEGLAPKTAAEAEVLRRVADTTLGIAHIAVLARLREIGHVHGAGHAEVRLALAQVLGQVGTERGLALDLLGYPKGERCRSRRGEKLVDTASHNPHPFGAERLRRVAIYMELPTELLAVPVVRALPRPDLVARYERRRRAAERLARPDPDLVERYSREGGM